MKNTVLTCQYMTEQFGQFELVRLSNGENEIAIVPAHGGHLLSLKMVVNGQSTNILDSYSTAEALQEQDYYKSSLLLPFPNRMKDGKFEFEGKTYQFPVNDLSTQNNLHGFKAFYDMKVKSVNTESEMPYITLSSIYNGHLPEFPFPFEFLITYALNGFNELLCEIALINIGDTNIPIGFGWHPYFQFEGVKVDDLALEMPSCEQVEIDERMLPTGKTIPFNAFNTPKKIQEQTFDNCFKSTTSDEVTEVSIFTPHTQLTFWQETQQFPYFQIFTPPFRQSIAIEPMTCNVDAFNNGDGLIVLAPKESFKGKFGVVLRDEV